MEHICCEGKIQAIKAVREHSELGLKEAKDLVELAIDTIVAHGGLVKPGEPDQGKAMEIVQKALLDKAKHLREQAGCLYDRARTIEDNAYYLIHHLSDN